jgi:hypothetical protein
MKVVLPNIPEESTVHIYLAEVIGTGPVFWDIMPCSLVWTKFGLGFLIETGCWADHKIDRIHLK